MLNSKLITISEPKTFVEEMDKRVKELETNRSKYIRALAKLDILNQTLTKEILKSLR